MRFIYLPERFCVSGFEIFELFMQEILDNGGITFNKGISISNCFILTYLGIFYVHPFFILGYPI